jgi:hypothetical protein
MLWNQRLGYTPEQVQLRTVYAALNEVLRAAESFGLNSAASSNEVILYLHLSAAFCE